jgi:N utilization substance protein B
MTTFMTDTDHPQEPKAPPKSARRRAREFALQGLYQWRVGGNDEASIEAFLPEMEDFAKADREFFVGTLRGVIAQQEPLGELIKAHIDRPFGELSPVEACILMMGCFEMRNHPETPYRVIINEAIELTKAFGGTDGHKYVNGVLDKIAGQLRPDEVAARKRGK